MWLFPVEFDSFGAGSNPAITTRPNGTKEYNFDDHLGNVRVVLSATGRTLTRADYKPFGGELWSFAGKSRRSFIGKEKDKESELGDFGVRKYDEEIGRFTSIDPLWEKYGALTPYHYTANNPLVFIDPSGFQLDATLALNYESGQEGEEEQARTQGGINAFIEDTKKKTGLTTLRLEGTKIVYDKGGKIDGGSKKARDIITTLIDMNETLDITYNTAGSGNAAPLGGTAVFLDPDKIRESIDGTRGGLDATTMGWALAFIHEYGHTKFGGSLTDDGYDDIGAVEATIVNPIRKELEEAGQGVFGKRWQYNGILTRNGKYAIPFTKHDKEVLNQTGSPLNKYVLRSTK